MRCAVRQVYESEFVCCGVYRSPSRTCKVIRLEVGRTSVAKWYKWSARSGDFWEEEWPAASAHGEILGVSTGLRNSHNGAQVAEMQPQP